MKHEMKELQEIVTRMVRQVDAEKKISGVGFVVLAFDSRGPVDRPVAVYLHGINPDEAVRVTRRAMDDVERSVKEDDKPLIVRPQLIVPAKS